MSNPQIEFYYLKGNHDSDNFFSKLDDIPENLHLFNEEWKTYDCGSISLSGIWDSILYGSVSYGTGGSGNGSDGDFVV